MSSPSLNCAAILTVVATLAVTSPPKSDAQVVWSGSGGNDEWTTGANWVGGTAPPSSPSTWLEFHPTPTNIANVTTPWVVNRIDFTEFITITGGELSFQGSNPQINGTGQFLNPIGIGPAGLNITAPPNRVVDLTGIVSGTGPIIASGGYVLVRGTLPNSYSGVFINQGATVAFRYESDMGTAPTAAADDITINGGTAEFLYTSSLSPTRNIFLGGAGSVPSRIRSYELLSIPGVIHGPGALTIEGEVQLVANNTYTGGTTIFGNEFINGRGSILSVLSPGVLGGTGANVTIESGTSLSAAYAIDQALLNRVNPSSSGSVILNANSANSLDFGLVGLSNVRLGATDGTWTYSGLLTPAKEGYRFGGGSGHLVVASTLFGTNRLEVSSNDNRRGSVELAAANSYSGGTTIGTSGNLLLAASGSTGTGLVTVNSRGLFGGNGIAAGGVHVGLEGSLSPGIDGTGVLTTGNLSFTSGTFILTLAGTIPGVNYDQVHSLGTVLLGSLPTLQLTLGYDPTVGDTFTIIDNDLNDSITGTFASFPEGSVFFLANGKGAPLRAFEITYIGGTGNDVVIRALPEAGMAMNLILAFGLVATSRFRRPH